MKNLLTTLRQLKLNLPRKKENPNLSNEIKEARRRTDKLTKSRPPRLATRNYVLIEDEEQINKIFFRMMETMLDITGVQGWRSLLNPPKVRAERGFLPENRLYFYLDPWEEIGWLFERAPYGWVISKADKIINPQTILGKQPWDGGAVANTFLREESWDAVSIYKPDDGSGLYRLSSRRLGKELVSFPVYEESLKNDFKFITVE